MSCAHTGRHRLINYDIADLICLLRSARSLSIPCRIFWCSRNFIFLHSKTFPDDLPTHADEHARNGPILACLHFLDMWTCQQHPHAANMRFQFQTDWWGTLPSGHRISVERVQIHGKTVGVSVRLEVEGGEGTTELVLVNWRTGRDQQQRVSCSFIYTRTYQGLICEIGSLLVICSRSISSVNPA